MGEIVTVLRAVLAPRLEAVAAAPVPTKGAAEPVLMKVVAAPKLEVEGAASRPVPPVWEVDVMAVYSLMVSGIPAAEVAFCRSGAEGLS